MISYSVVEVPENFLCPITQEIMTDPVVASDGQSYQRESISEWLSRGHRRSPLNGDKLPNANLLNNLTLKKIINEYQISQPEIEGQNCIKSYLEKCIREKEDMIKNLIEKIDLISQSQSNSNKYNKQKNEEILEKENLELKNKFSQLEINLLSIEQANQKELIEKDREILRLKIEINQIDQKNIKFEQEKIQTNEETFGLKNKIKELEEKIKNLENVNLESFSLILKLKEQIKTQEEVIHDLVSNFSNHINNQPIEINNQTNQEIKKQLDLEQSQQIEEDHQQAAKNKLGDIDVKLNDAPLIGISNIDINDLKKCSYYDLQGEFNGIIELNQGLFFCWGKQGIKLFKITGDKFELIKNLRLKTDDLIHTIQLKEDIICAGGYEVVILDQNFNLIESFKEPKGIWSMCKISKVSFAIGLGDGTIKNYFLDFMTNKYLIKSNYRSHSNGITSLLYLPSQNFLLSGSADKNLIVYCLHEEKALKKHIANETISSLICLNHENFASYSKGEIKIWSTNPDMKCIKTIFAHEDSSYVYLHLFENDLMVSRSLDGCEFKIWNLKNYECLTTCKENSVIISMIVTKSNFIINGTDDKKVNLWKRNSECNSDSSVSDSIKKNCLIF